MKFHLAIHRTVYTEDQIPIQIMILNLYWNSKIILQIISEINPTKICWTMILKDIWVHLMLWVGVDIKSLFLN